MFVPIANRVDILAHTLVNTILSISYRVNMLANSQFALGTM